MGLLASAGEDKWEIVPSLYARDVRPLREHDGLLWVEEGGDGLLALDKSLAVQRRLPTVKGRCIAIGPRGFWCVERGVNLVGYSAEGRQRAFFPTDGKQLPKGTIYWAAVDGDAVWLAIMEYVIPKGIYNGPAVPGESWLVRLSPATGEFSQVDIRPWPGPPFVNLPRRVLWVRKAAETEWDVEELDKATLRVQRAGRIASPYVSEMATDGQKLWVFSSTGWRVFSLDGLKPVALQDAGKPPPGSPSMTTESYCSLLSPSKPWFLVLAADPERVWLSAAGPSLVELRDDGVAEARDLSSLIPRPIDLSRAFALPGVFYGWLYRSGSLLRVEAGDATATERELVEFKNRKMGHLYLATASDRWLWLATTSNGNMLALAPDFSRHRIVGPVMAGCVENENAVARGDWLYLHLRNSGECVRASALTGEVAPIRSWSGKCGGGWGTAFGLPDGRMNVQGPRRDRVDNWIYDPATDKWQHVAWEGWVRPVAASDRLYGIRDDSLVKWQDNGWQRLGTPPFSAWLRAGGEALLGSTNIVGTSRYLYLRTPLGLYRVAWAAFGDKEPREK
jgi:hypothetical protein